MPSRRRSSAWWRGGRRPDLVARGGRRARRSSGSFWVAIARGRRRLREPESKSDQLASQLDRRISELFSLQELSYVLSESIQLDRIVDQVAKYAARFLQADGAIVVLADDERGRRLRVVARVRNAGAAAGPGHAKSPTRRWFASPSAGADRGRPGRDRAAR